MSEAPEIVLCPTVRRGEAIALVLSEIAPSQRGEIVGGLLRATDARDADAEALYVAMHERRIVGATWGQRQAGNTAVFWPPTLVGGADAPTAIRLAEAVVQHLDRMKVGFTQVLLPSRKSELTPILMAAGFSHLADLIYLTCEADRFVVEPAMSPELQFSTYDAAQRQRLAELVERTYEGTLDCAALNGVRKMEDVIDGYQATGKFRAENWQIARSGGRDIGVLLMAEHSEAGHWELMYMGLVPEARGHGWGRHLTRQAQRLAKSAGVQRIVLAVDAKNRPARAMYARDGFTAWDQRSVLARFFVEQ